MKWFRVTSAVIATLGLTTAAHAGLLDLFGSHGSSKSCGCVPSCQPQCCKPTIVKPCCPNIYTYQRKLSCLKPPCCDRCCAPKGCCQPMGKCCVNPQQCAPTCAAPANCAPAAPANCAPAPACAAPAPAPANCAPACPPTCAAPAKCAPACAPATCAPACQPTCAAPVANCCPKQNCCQKRGCFRNHGCCQKQGCCQTQGCCNRSNRCCNVDPCKLAKWIYKSQTSCYAKDRRKAIRYLGKHFDCQCSPEIMTAFIYALNDAVEDVREEAAEQIRRQVDKNHCCCSKEVIAALTAALGDCDKGVRREAEKGLEECGYEVVKGCCECVSCDPCSCNYGGHRTWMKGGNGMQPTPAPKDKKAAPPAPGTQKVYFPARLRRYRPAKSRARLANLFGLLN